MIATPPSTAAAGVPPTVVEEEEEYDEEGGERPLWPWLVAAGFVIAAIIAGFFVYQELSGSKATVPVNNYVNEQQSHAEQQIRAAHLVPAVKQGPSERYKKGIVFKQDPSAGSKLEKGSTVTIWVSTGPPKVTVPAVKGQQWPDAQQALVNAGLKPVEHIVPGEPKGQVTATDPAAGERVPKGSKVRVNVYERPGDGGGAERRRPQRRRGPGEAPRGRVQRESDLRQQQHRAAGPGHQPEPCAGHDGDEGHDRQLQRLERPAAGHRAGRRRLHLAAGGVDPRGRRLPGHPAVPVDGREPGQHRPVAESARQLPGGAGLDR